MSAEPQVCSTAVSADAGAEVLGIGGVEPLRQNVKQEAPDELVRLERHRAEPRRRPLRRWSLVAERHAALVEACPAGCSRWRRGAV